MNNIYIVSIPTLILLLLSSRIFKLTYYQNTVMISGGIFIILYYGLINQLLMNWNRRKYISEIKNIEKENDKIIKQSVIMSIFFMIWYYMTYKITNVINTDQNNNIHYN